MSHDQFLLVAALSPVAVACGGSAGASELPYSEGGHASSGGYALDDNDSGGTTGLSSSDGSFNVSNSIDGAGSVDAAAYTWMATCAGRCASDQVCCIGIIPSASGSDLPAITTSNCQAGPCPAVNALLLQVCSSADECFTAGDTCGPIGGSFPSLVVMVCNPPGRDGGSSSISSSGSESDSSNSADP